MLPALQRRELLRNAGQLSDELGMGFDETCPGEQIEGVLRRTVELASGRYALIAKAKEFTLVTWRPVLDRHVGKSIAGIMREGDVSWSIGRGRRGTSFGRATIADQNDRGHNGPGDH